MPPVTDLHPGSTAVVFSSGFFGFFAHAGVLAAVREVGTVPSAYGGTSSGAIVAAMAASGMDEGAIKEILFRLKKADFWDPDPWPDLVRWALRLFRGYTGYLNGEGFAQMLGILPVKTFEALEAPLAVAATDLSRKREAVFTRGDLIRAVQASGAVPGLFKAVKIEGAYYVDGGITCKAPVRAVADLVQPRRILVHYMASQNLEEELNGFLKKRLSPWYIHLLAGNIARQEAYRLQLEIVRGSGIEIVEIRTSTPLPGPNRLKAGPLAYEEAKRQALAFLTPLKRT